MWTIECFIEENCVETVPAFWFKNWLCAWSKKMFKKMQTNAKILIILNLVIIKLDIGKYLFLFYV